jgi:hypothetical protein
MSTRSGRHISTRMSTDNGMPNHSNVTLSGTRHADMIAVVVLVAVQSLIFE